MKPIVTLTRIIIVGLCWSIFFLEGIRVILLTNWHFDLIDPKHWLYVWNLWLSGWVIDDKRELAFILIIFSFIPLWLTGWASLSLIHWEEHIKNAYKKLISVFELYIFHKDTPKKTNIQNTAKPIIKRKKSYKEIRPRNLNSLATPQSNQNNNPSPIVANRTMPNVKPILTPSTPAQPTTSILDHSLFKFDDDSNDFDLNFDDLDNIKNTSNQQINVENTETSPMPSDTKPERHNKKENNKDNSNNKPQRDNKKNNKTPPVANTSHKNVGNSSLEVIKQKGYQVITSATIKNNLVDFIGVADNQLCICIIDKEVGDWLADEERFNDEEPLWFSESSHRISPVRCADIVREHLSEKLQSNGFNFKISTFVVIQYGDIINAEDMFETWNNMDINVTRIDRGMPRELKLFAKTLEDADNSIDNERFEKIKKIIRNLN